MCWNERHQSHFWWRISGSPGNQENVQAIATLNTSLLWPYRQWASDQFFISITWHNTPRSFVGAVARWYCDENFPYPNGPVLLIKATIQLKIGVITELDLAFTDGIILKFLDCVICEISPLHSVYLPPPTLVAGTIVFCMDATSLHLLAFIMIFGGIIKCWYECWIEMVNWSSRNARARLLLSLVTTLNFLPGALFLAS